MSMQYQKNETRNTEETLTILFKHKTKILACLLVTMTVVTIATFLVKPVYESTSNLLVKYGREYIYTSQLGERISQQRIDMEGVVNAETQILTSQDLADEVIQSVGVDTLYPDLMEFSSSPRAEGMSVSRNRFAKSLSVKGMEGSGVIQVAFRHTDPSVASTVVNKLVDFYKARHLQAYIDPTTSTFLEEKTNEYNKKLKDMEDKLHTLKAQHSAYDMESQMSLLLQQREGLNADSMASQNRIAELGKKLSSLQAQVDRVRESAREDTDSARYSILDDAKKNLLELRLQEQELLKKYTESSQAVTAIRSEIKTVQDFLSQQERGLREGAPAGNPVYQDLQKQIVNTKAEYHSQMARSATLKTQVHELDARLRRLTGPENELRSLEREISTSENNYKTYSTKLEEARIIEEMNRRKMTNISVIQAATTPVDPISPRRKMNFLLSILLGGLLGIGMAFAAEYLSQQFSSPCSIGKRLEIPVLAAVPLRPRLPVR